MTNDVVAANSTDSVTPTRLSPGVCAYTARIDPGAAGARRPAPKIVSVKMPDHATGDGAEQQDRLHQHVREVDLVDAAEELDDRRGRRGALGQPGAEDRVGQQHTEAGAGVGLQQEQDRLAGLASPG